MNIMNVKEGPAMGSEMLSTKMTSSGQTTVPKEIRELLGIADGARVYWIVDGNRAYLSATPSMPLEVHSSAELGERLAIAEADLTAGRVNDAREVGAQIRSRYGI